MKSAETSRLDPGEIDTESPKTIIVPSSLDSSRRTELRYSPWLCTKIDAVSSSPT